MIKTLGLVEETMHNEVLWAYYHSLVKEYDEITIFCNTKCYEQLYDLHEEGGIIWVTWVQKEDFTAVLNTHKSKLESLDEIIFTTILPSSFTYFIKTHFSNHISVVLHDLNYFLDAENNFQVRWNKPTLGFKDIAKILRYYLKGEKKRNKKFLSKFSQWIVPTEEMKSSLFDKWDKHDYVKVVPFVIEAPEEYFNDLRQESDFFEIVIPGTIIEKSRDYRGVIEALEQIDFERNTRITLLGRAIDGYGMKTQTQFMYLETRTLKIQVFQEFVHQKIFDKIMTNADLLILPIQPIMGIYPVVEQNGFTCVSGNVNDMIKYQKKALIPEFYPIWDEHKLAIRYQDTIELKSEIIKQSQP